MLPSRRRSGAAAEQEVERSHSDYLDDDKLSDEDTQFTVNQQLPQTDFNTIKLFTPGQSSKADILKSSDLKTIGNIHINESKSDVEKVNKGAVQDINRKHITKPTTVKGFSSTLLSIRNYNNEATVETQAIKLLSNSTKPVDLR